MSIHDIVTAQRQALSEQRRQMASAVSQAHHWQAQADERIAKLRRLRDLLTTSESAILKALQDDLGKGPGEAYLTELGIVLSELNHTIRHLKRWMRPQRVAGSLSVFPSRSRRLPEPYGLVLIMSPWNYPFQLTITPLIGAIAAGNRCVVKPSNQTPRSAQLMADLITAWLPPEEAAVVQGGREENQQLLDERFDYIFFTGGHTVGRLVMQKAAEHLTPLTLELGGKSPCIVDASADIQLAARRIAFGKGMNAGQTCVAPDYLLVHHDIKEALLQAIQAQWQAFYGQDALNCDQWPRIINQKHYERLMALMQGEKIVCGGQGDGQRIAPTLIDEVSWQSPLMQEEIFGPLLPVISYERLDEAIEQIQQRDKPLALYVFSQDQGQTDKILQSLSFGGGCVNDTLIQLSNPHLPFGGVGASGMGSYHGRHSFDTFSHYKSVLYKGKMDFPFRYPPYSDNKTKLLKRFLK